MFRRNHTVIDIHTNVLLADHTTLRVGGHAAFFVEVTSTEDLFEVITYTREKGLPWTIIGGGSNILVSDKGFDGLVIKMVSKGIDVVHEDDESVDVCVAAGEWWDTFVAWCVERGYWGVENLSGIPGTVGATPIQNVGAYGVEVSHVITSVEVFDTQTLKTTHLLNEACEFGYRDSVFKKAEGKRFIVLSVTMRLPKNGSANISYKDLAEYFKDQSANEISLHDMREAVLTIRARKFPDLSRVGTAGSFFKNPIVSNDEAGRLRTRFPDMPLYQTALGYKASAAWLLDKACGLKGFTEGNVQLFDAQPLVLVAHAGATAHEIDTCAHNIQQKVFDTTGIVLEREVQNI